MLPRVREYFDERADTYSALYGDRMSWRWFYHRSRWYPLFRYRAIVETEIRITPGLRVLDLGCGAGADAVRFARHGAHVHAIDFSPAMLEHARARAAAEGASVTFTEADVGPWLAANTADYDVGLAIGLFDYAADPREWLRAIGRRCQLLVATFPRLSLQHTLAAARYRLMGLPARTYALADIRTWLAEAGYARARVLTPLGCGYVVIASRTRGEG